MWPSACEPSLKKPAVQLNLQPGSKGLKKLLGAVPSWITFQEREKVEVRPCQLTPLLTAFLPMSCAPCSRSRTTPMILLLSVTLPANVPACAAMRRGLLQLHMSSSSRGQLCDQQARLTCSLPAMRCAAAISRLQHEHSSMARA